MVFWVTMLGMSARCYSGSFCLSFVAVLMIANALALATCCKGASSLAVNLSEVADHLVPFLDLASSSGVLLTFTLPPLPFLLASLKVPSVSPPLPTKVENPPRKAHVPLPTCLPWPVPALLPLPSKISVAEEGAHRHRVATRPRWRRRSSRRSPCRLRRTARSPRCLRRWSRLPHASSPCGIFFALLVHGLYVLVLADEVLGLDLAVQLIQFATVVPLDVLTLRLRPSAAQHILDKAISPRVGVGQGGHQRRTLDLDIALPVVEFQDRLQLALNRRVRTFPTDCAGRFG